MLTKNNDLPLNSILQKDINCYHYVDTFIGRFFDGQHKISSADTCRAFFMTSPKLVRILFNLRNRIVNKLGLKTGTEESLNKDDLYQTDFSNIKFVSGETIGLFKIYEITDREVILGQDDKHLDFRVSLYLDPEFEGENHTLNYQKEIFRKISISTTVKYNNWFGKVYFYPVKPFHKMIVPTMLKGTIKHLEIITRRQ